MPTFAVLGPGGVGGFLAAALDRAGETVTVVAREPTAALIAARGLSVRSRLLGDFHAAPPAVARLLDPVDVLLVTPKATDLDAALERIEVGPRLAIPLLNGVDGVDRLRRRFAPEAVAAGTIRIESDRPQPGVIVQTSPAVRVELAHDAAGAERDALASVAATLSRAGVPAVIGSGERQVLWSKAIRLTALASTTSVADLPLGAIRDDPEWAARLAAVVREAAAVASADGAPSDPETTLAELDAAPAELGSSMQRDLRAGRTPELDAIQGSVLRAAARHGLTCPTIESLARQIASRAGLPPPGSDGA